MCWKVWLESWLSSSQFPRSAVALANQLSCRLLQLRASACSSPPHHLPSFLLTINLWHNSSSYFLAGYPAVCHKTWQWEVHKYLLHLCKLLNRVHGCKNELAQNPTKVKLILTKKMFSENGLSPHPAHLHRPPCHCQPGKALTKNRYLFLLNKEGFPDPGLEVLQNFS